MRRLRNKKLVLNDIPFDSITESIRYVELVLEGVENLEVQPTYLLIPAFRDINGKAVRKTEYSPDFRYKKDGVEVVEDVKGYATPVYRLKKKMLLNLNRGINFYENPSKEVKNRHKELHKFVKTEITKKKRKEFTLDEYMSFMQEGTE